MIGLEQRTRGSLAGHVRLAGGLALALLLAGCPSPRNEPPVDAEAVDTNVMRYDSRATTPEPAPRPTEMDAPAGCDQQACSLATKDGCCPAACTASSDADCSASCGNGVVESNETCDPPGSCPSSCLNRACTTFELQGSPAQCNVRCVETAPISVCKDGDGCCPPTCNASNDKDCLVTCGNGVKEGSETCDPLASCPGQCPPMGCQLRKLVNAGTCTAECVNDAVQTKCQGGDGCCPDACNANTDSDCTAKCGNNIKEPGEACDGDCPTSCPADGCNLRRLEGSGCGARCVSAGTQTQCRGGDGCCPGNCNANNDSDCNARCGNDVVESGEDCDGNCPTSCPDQNCRKRMLTGSGCHARCVDSGPVTACRSDGCGCGNGCNFRNDNDCPRECNGTERKCSSDRKTLLKCNGGVFDREPCSGTCFEAVDDGGPAGPRCGCKLVNCTCDGFVDFSQIGTGCGLQGIDNQNTCEDLGLGKCTSIGGRDTCTGGNPFFCPPLP